MEKRRFSEEMENGGDNAGSEKEKSSESRGA